MKRILRILMGIATAICVLSFIGWIDHYQETLQVLMVSEDPLDVVFNGIDPDDVIEAQQSLQNQGYGQGAFDFIQDRILFNRYTMGMILSFGAFLAVFLFYQFWSFASQKRKEEAICLALQEEQFSLDDPVLRQVQNLCLRYQDRLREMALDTDSQRQEYENIAHQMKSALAAILLNADQLPDEQNVLQKELIIEQVERCNEMLNRFLGGHEVRANVSNYHYKVNDLKDCIQTAASHVRERSSKNGIRIEETAESCIFVFDSFWMREAIETLLMNAVEFARKDSVVRIFTRKENDNVQIHIQNEGDCPGDLPFLFTRYGTSHKNTEHYGIGLHMVKTVCKNHQGDVRAGYADGIVTFTVVLPFYRLETIEA